jgi:hypothetical protein
MIGDTKIHDLRIKGVEVEVYKFLNSVTDGDESYFPHFGHLRGRDYLESTEQKAATHSCSGYADDK